MSENEKEEKEEKSRQAARANDDSNSGLDLSWPDTGGEDTPISYVLNLEVKGDFVVISPTGHIKVDIAKLAEKVNLDWPDTGGEGTTQPIRIDREGGDELRIRVNEGYDMSLHKMTERLRLNIPDKFGNIKSIKLAHELGIKGDLDKE